MSFDSFEQSPQSGSGIYGFFKLDFIRDEVTLLYVGQTRDYASRITKNHHRHDAARYLAAFGLYVGFRPMPGSTEASRCFQESILIQQLQPVLNGRQ